jgi:hypothetical protein
MLAEDIGSIFIKTDKKDKANALFEKHATGIERALVGKPNQGWVAIYPREADTACKWAELFSKEMKTTALALMVNDDEVFSYKLYFKGQLLDKYANKPAFFLGNDPDVPSSKILEWRGNSDVWEPYLINGKECRDVGKILHSGFDDPRTSNVGSDYIIASTIMEDFCEMLGIVGPALTYGEINDELEEWEEDQDLADEDDPDGDSEFGMLDCQRHVSEFSHVRAPRKTQKI